MDADRPVILVADDEADSLKLLTEILRAEGYEVRAADSGRLALASAAAHPPHLILLDLFMPGMDGLELCRRLKASEATRQTPLMFISGVADVEQRVQGLALGAVDFVTKPFRREELAARVRTHLELGRLRANLEREVGRRTVELRTAMDELRESEERFRLMADTAPVLIWLTGQDMSRSFFNQRWLEFTGRSMEQESGDGWLAGVHPDDVDRYRDEHSSAFAALREFRIEYRLLRADGEPRWMLSHEVPRFLPGHCFAGYVGSAIDMTESKLAQEALRASEARLASGVELAGLGFYEVNYAKSAVYLDGRIRELSGIPPDREQDLQALQFWTEHLHPDDRERVLEERLQLLDGRIEKLSVEYRYLHPVHGQKWIHHMSSVAARDSAGCAVHTLSVFRDVTERRQAEEDLKQSYAEIERLKDRLQAEGDYLRAEMNLTHQHGSVIGQSPAISKVLRLVEQVAPTDSSVLVGGETGTGKELIAQAIHRLSPRRNSVIVKVNCAALPSGLVESELFGRERGAYTGAMTRQVGRFEIADGSTLFLDEVGELPLDLQSKLLRVLESGEFERLGNPRTIKVNVRVVAATNRDLPEAIRQGKFREDLYYRLNVFPILVPPLRERAEDVPLLVWGFLEEFCTRMGKRITQVPRQTMESLQRHSWPGNIRELRNVVEHAVIITTGDTLRIPMLAGAAPVAASRQTLQDVEREHILRVLEKSGWHIKGPKGAAAELGMNPATLYGRMKKLSIRRSL